MISHPIRGQDAELYLAHVHAHGLEVDTRWLLDTGRFPVGCRVLDVGCGTGTLVESLAADRAYARSVVGAELSPVLAAAARRRTVGCGAKIIRGDFLDVDGAVGWQPDIIVMSFFLHHSDDVAVHLRHAAELLPHGGRLYVFDRVARSERDLAAFGVYWREHYRAAHEWFEEQPQLVTFNSLVETAEATGFAFVRHEVSPHDKRPGTEGFPKTFMEFWRQESRQEFPALGLVSPAHRAYSAGIYRELHAFGLTVREASVVPYTGRLIRSLYGRCPWREQLVSFVRQTCPEGAAEAFVCYGNASRPASLQALIEFKQVARSRWPALTGPEEQDGTRAMILPFHVPEPHEVLPVANLVFPMHQEVVPCLS